MRVLTIILLVCFFLFDSVGVYFLFENKLQMARSDAEGAMRLLSQQKKMVTIVIDKNSEKKVSWMDDHEFRYYNKMYDVVSATDSGNQVVYTCYEDENETNVVSELVNHIKNVASPYSSRNTSLKDHWPTDKYFSLQLKISIQSVQATSCGRDILLLPPDIVYCIIPTQPPDCI